MNVEAPADGRNLGSSVYIVLVKVVVCVVHLTVDPIYFSTGRGEMCVDIFVCGLHKPVALLLLSITANKTLRRTSECLSWFSVFRDSMVLLDQVWGFLLGRSGQTTSIYVLSFNLHVSVCVLELNFIYKAL